MFYGITKDNIKAEVLKGRFVISNIGLRESLFEATNMPYDLRHSYVEKVELHINWTSNERVLTININKIYALLSIKQDLNLDAIFMKLKKSKIKDYITEILKNISGKLEREKDIDKEKEKEKSGGISGFIKRLLDNINIKINSIHFRFEDEKKTTSFGLRIEQIEIINVDEKEVAGGFFNREKTDQNHINYRLTIDPLHLYLNPNETNFLHLKDLASITNEMMMMDNNKAYEGQPSLSDPWMWKNSNMFNNVLVISIKGLLKRYIDVTDKPEYECKITFKKIDSVISDGQFHCILSIIKEIIWYQGMLQHYTSKVEIIPRKEREAKEIMNLIKKPKNSKKEKEVVKMMSFKFLLWAFKETHIEIIKKKFFTECLKKEITVDNLFESEKIRNIIRKIPIVRIKEWIEVCIEMRKKYEKEVTLFTEKKKKIEKLYKKELEKIKLLKEQKEQKLLNHENKEESVFLILTVEINQLNINISKNNIFGIQANTENTKIIIEKRKSNFKLQFSLEDLSLHAFKSGFGHKNPTSVSILRKSLQSDKNTQQNCLMKLEFEKSPIGKPFVFSSSKLNFQSIEITVYPEVLSKLYDIFIKEKVNKNEAPKIQLKKKKTNLPNEEHVSAIVGTGFQYNIIEGFIESPWIIIPLSHTNDLSKDCWVLRLGDLVIDTPSYDSSMKSDQRLFYERFFIELRNFELKYFSSISFFNIWLHHGNSIENFNDLPGFKNNKHVDIIEPVSCSVDLCMLKQHVSNLVKKAKESYIIEIKIEKVFIRLPKLILDKMKHRVDIFENEQKNDEFIETNPTNILEENTIEGLITVTNDKFKSMTLYTVLKGYFLYFFFIDNKEDILFSIDVRDTTIRLTSDHHTFINEGKNKKLYLQLKEKETHGLWKRHLIQLISKRGRIENINNNNKNTNNSNNNNPNNNNNNNNNNNTNKNIEESEVSLKKEELDKIMEIETNFLKLGFIMQKMEIQLIDEFNDIFLECSFKKTKLKYSNLKEKAMTFSILDWKIEEYNKNYNKQEESEKNKKKNKNIMFLSCQRLIKEKNENTLGETKKEINQEEEEDNFLEVKAIWNYITNELNEIDVQVNQLYISWNLPTFNKILKFFFYKSEMGDAPTTSSGNKKSLILKLKVKRFFLYCYHDEEIIALLKLHETRIIYSQNNMQEKYLIDCQKFEMDKYEDDNENKRIPMILCHKKMEELNKQMKRMRKSSFSENDSFKIEDSFYDEHFPSQDKTHVNEKESINPMFLEYTIRKHKTENHPNITKLKEKFGDDILVSELKCTWKDFIIYFDMEQTIRLINYFINQILGSAASKFKKKEYSLNYIAETLKIKKLTCFDINFTNFVAIMTPHSRVDHCFEVSVSKVDFTKNIRNEEEIFEPKMIEVQTKKDKVKLFFDTMVFDITNITLYYKYKFYTPEPITKQPFHVQVTYNKLNFSREYEPILNSLDDIDRTVKVNIKIMPGFHLELPKIVFLTLLQIFYQNIKHRDGKAEKFEIPHPFPSKKIYTIDLGQVEVDMYEYDQEEKPSKKQQNHTNPKDQRKSLNQKNTPHFVRKMEIFEKLKTNSLQIRYENQGTNSEISINFSEIQAYGDLPVAKNNPTQPSSLNLKMDSTEGETFLKIVPKNLQLFVNLDKLNNVIEFTNYDSDYVSNKIMPKKNKVSYMTVSIFPDLCCAQLGELEIHGEFFITYTKDFKNPIEKHIITYLFEDEIKKKGKTETFFDPRFINEQISDKEIKVNGQNLSLFLNDKHIGVLKKLYFGRTEHAAKETLKRYRQEFVSVDGLSAMPNILELKQLYQIYEGYIKKAKDYKDKIFILPFQEVPIKPKSSQKRVMEVQIERSNLNIMRMLPERRQKSYAPFMSYLTIEFMIPKLSYITHLQEQLISLMDLQIKILQYGNNSMGNKILECTGLRLQYLENKFEHSKYIEIENAKNILININNMNEKLLALLAKEIFSINKLKSIENERATLRQSANESLFFKHNHFNSEQHFGKNKLEKFTNHMDNQFLLVFENMTCKNMEITINNFTLNSSNNNNNSNNNNTNNNNNNKINKLVVLSKERKIFNLSGINLLEFLDQSTKEICKNTEICFKQEGNSAIKLKNLRELIINSEMELFESCSIKYSSMPNGIKLEIFEPYSIYNMTFEQIQIDLYDKNKNKINPNIITIEPGCELFLSNINNLPYYFTIVKTSTTEQPQFIQISDLPTNLSPNRNTNYQSNLLSIIRWEHEKSSAYKLQLIIFNKFRMINNLPVKLEINYLTIQPFKEIIIDSRKNKNEKEENYFKIRIDHIHEISYNYEELYQHFIGSFISTNKPIHKKQNTPNYYKLNASQTSNKPPTGSEAIYYKINIYGRVGYEPTNLFMETGEKEGDELSWYKNQFKLKTNLSKFIINNQITIVVGCSKILENNISSKNSLPFRIGGYLGNERLGLGFKKNMRYTMVPHNVQGLYMESTANTTSTTNTMSELDIKYKFETDTRSDKQPNQSMKIWGKYLLRSFSHKTENISETIYRIEDICNLENKTEYVIEAAYKSRGMMPVSKLNKIIILPGEKINIPIIRSDHKILDDFIEISAYMRNNHKENKHLKCTTRLSLRHLIEQKNNKEEELSWKEILYWSLNPRIINKKKWQEKYEENMLKINCNKYNYENEIQYEFIIEQNTEHNNNNNNNNKEENYGYLFVNNLPTNYAILIHEQNGIIPEEQEISSDILKYYDTFDEEQEMIIPFDIQEQPSPILTKKQNSKKSITESFVSSDHNKSNRLEFSRENKLNQDSTQIVEYLLEPQEQLYVGLTDLQHKNNGKCRNFILEIYRVDCNLEYEQKFEIKIDEEDKCIFDITIEEDEEKIRRVTFGGEEFQESEEIRSKRTALQVMSKKSQNNSASKAREFKVQVLPHKKNSQLEFYIESPELTKAYPALTVEPADYKRSLSLKIFEISLTIQVTQSPQDTLTLELLNLSLKQSQLPPSSHTTQLSLNIEKLLIREDKNLPILKMLHESRELLSTTICSEKVMTGNRFKNIWINLQPLELDIREGILFKILSRIVEIRNYYFLTSMKLDQILNKNLTDQNDQNNTNLSYENKSYLSIAKENLFQKEINSQISKNMLKILIMDDLQVLPTNIYLSYSKDSLCANKEKFVHDPIIKYFILVPAVSELKLAIPEIEVSGFKGSNKEMVKKMMEKIKANLGSTVLRSLNSFSLFDSPVAAIDGVMQYLEAILMIHNT